MTGAFAIATSAATTLAGRTRSNPCVRSSPAVGDVHVESGVATNAARRNAETRAMPTAATTTAAAAMKRASGARNRSRLASAYGARFARSSTP
jgi:hypothetical protein